MKITVRQLVDSMESGALQRLTQTALPASAAFRMKPIIVACNTARNDYEKVRDERFTAHGWELIPEPTPQNPQGARWVPGADVELAGKVWEELNTLLAEEIEIPGQPLTPGMLLSTATFTVQDLIALDWLIVERTAPPEPEKPESPPAIP